MFTGLIQHVGALKGISRIKNDSAVLDIAHEASWPGETIQEGESLAVQGVCLTVASAAPGRVKCNVLDETLQRSNLAGKKPGAVLNLERALRAGDRIGGHFVTGHVDGTGFATRIVRQGGDRVLSVKCSREILCQIVNKGSVSCDGVSLTVTGIRDSEFDVKLVPFTWEHTSFGSLRPRDAVNIESDVLGKYVQSCLKEYAGGGDDVEKLLRESGFI
ncbi:MAG: riboflavin synthase [Kiritimatiellia bacterium]